MRGSVELTQDFVLYHNRDHYPKIRYRCRLTVNHNYSIQESISEINQPVVYSLAVKEREVCQRYTPNE